MGSATSQPTLQQEREVAFANAFATYVAERYNNFVNSNTIASGNAPSFSVDLYITGSNVLAEEYGLQVIERSNYDSSNDTISVWLSFIANKIGGTQITYRGNYHGTKVGSAAATGTCTLDELAPTMFNTTTDRICYRGTGSTGVMKEMIQFIDNTNDDNGYGIVIGGGGPTIIGGGESARYILANPSNTYSSSNGAENMIIANDNGILFLTNLDGGHSAMRRTTLDSNGNLLLNSGGIYIGANKTSMYTQSGVMLHPYGYLSLTNPSDIGTRAGIYFAWNNASSNTAYIKEISSGNLELGPNYLTLHCIHNSSVTGYSLLTDGANGKRMSFLSCNTSTQLAMYGQWGSTSSYGYRYVAVTTSDPRLKENIIKSNINALSIINKIPMYSFNWKSDNKHWDVGYIATEMFDIDPNLVMIPDSEDDKDKYWSVNDFYLSGLQTKAIQELSAENKQLKAEITELKNTLNSINERLKKLEV